MSASTSTVLFQTKQRTPGSSWSIGEVKPFETRAGCVKCPAKSAGIHGEDLPVGGAAIIPIFRRWRTRPEGLSYMPQLTELVRSRTKIGTCFWLTPGLQNCTFQIFLSLKLHLSPVIKIHFICLWNNWWVISNIYFCLCLMKYSTPLWNSVLLRAQKNATFFMKLTLKSLQKIEFLPPLPSIFVCGSCGLSSIMSSSGTGTVLASSLDPILF